MIVGARAGDILTGPERHVAFAVNCEGINGRGLADSIARDFWPELTVTGPVNMGEILSKDMGDTARKVFHALVVYSLEEGWANVPHHIEACFNALAVPTDEEVASVVMGAGMAGEHTGADPAENLIAMARSNKRIIVYHPEAGK